MTSKAAGFRSIDEYIATFPEETQKILQEVRAVIHSAAPEAEEAISYQIPTFVFKGNLIHFAGYKNHIGLYPTPGGIEAFQKELAPYKKEKGSIRFPLDQPLPMDLIRQIVQFRVAETLQKEADKAALKASKKKKVSETAVGDLPAGLASPAHRALSAAGIHQLTDFTKISEAELRQLHGMGPKGIEIIKEAMAEQGLVFANPSSSI